MSSISIRASQTVGFPPRGYDSGFPLFYVPPGYAVGITGYAHIFCLFALSIRSSLLFLPFIDVRTFVLFYLSPSYFFLSSPLSFFPFLSAPHPLPLPKQSTGNCNYEAPNSEEAFQDLSVAGVEGCDDLEAARVAAAAGAALAIAAFRCSRSKESAADGSGGEGDKETAAEGTSFSTFSTAAISSSGNWSIGSPRSSSPLSGRPC